MTVFTRMLFTGICILISLRMDAAPQPDSAGTGNTEVYVFLSETCPICQSYTLTLRQLSEKYKSQHVIFFAVFPNYYSDKDSINAFMERYRLSLVKPVFDQTGSYTKEFKATITPEVFVKSAEGRIVYSGRIDDTFYSLGKRRNVISSNDLDNALTQLMAHREITHPKTTAVGCIISPPGSK